MTNEIADTDIFLEDAMVLSKHSPAIVVGDGVTGAIRNNIFANVEIPPRRLASRPRLRRFAPLARRLSLMHMVWRWM